MSTDYRLRISSDDGTETLITVSDSLIPTNDSWKADDSTAWDASGGAVSSWASGGAYLTGPYGVQSIFLKGFLQSTSPGDSGTGEKNYPEGTLPGGSFAWTCLSKD